MKKIIVFVCFFTCMLSVCLPIYPAYAMEVEPMYVIYDTEGNYLFERIDVKVGDEYIDKTFNAYKVISIDEDSHTGKAKFVTTYTPKKNLYIRPVSDTKRIGLYMSHNDESYVSGDGYDSVYGAGGIHDIAKKLKKEFESKGVEITLDETLHIPHDTYAYSRSKATATKIINNTSPDAIFDIHRDGTSRGFYIAKVDGVERCMVRIVIGKSNPYMSANKEFALSLMSKAQEMYPWLFVDLYIGQGHYNQALHNQALLFEMGSHLVEKDLVSQTTSNLVDVVYATLYGDEIVQKPAEPDDNVGSLGDTNQDLDKEEDSSFDKIENDSDKIMDNNDQENSSDTVDDGVNDDADIQGDQNISNDLQENEAGKDSVVENLNNENSNGQTWIVILVVALLLSGIAYYIFRSKDGR